MRTLFLLRHAKSDWDDPNLPDFDRPLALRGRDAAIRMGVYWRQAGLHVDLVLSSPSMRTRQTLALMEGANGGPLSAGQPAAFDDQLYLASPSTLALILEELPDDVAHVLLIGHNPGFEETALALSGSAETGLMAKLHDKFPTGALARIDLPIARWRDLSLKAGHLALFLRPVDLDVTLPAD